MSFVSENNRLSGYKTCIEALKHPMGPWLRKVPNGWDTAPYRTLVVIAHPALRLRHLATWNHVAFLITRVSSVFSEVGALWFFLTLCMWFEKRFRQLSNGSVLWFGFLFVVIPWTVSFFSPVTVLLVRGAAQAWEWPYTHPSRQVTWRAIPLSVSLGKEESHSTCGFSGTLFFSGALATAAAILFLKSHHSQSCGH